MFCPRCRMEYQEGVTECSDCKVTLVRERTHQADPDFYNFVKVTLVFEEGTIALIKSVFDEEEMLYYFKGELSHRLVPLLFSTTLMVREEDLPRAKEILRDLNLL